MWCESCFTRAPDDPFPIQESADELDEEMPIAESDNMEFKC